ncbi:stearoyl-CoA desaturase (delta-9 desaturase) [Catalinimonas alkaloidigena]|uniref:Stearoyl-CoA desaturase (Delta-9 desaturase) n=1 Tax=Catalinimonas alkaloidigena TaxID=1075417 RepID=A0A1G9GGI6_9BACT|nr:acyl-CoA desaturase [Catalinimonas alkaloidigena]SDK99808.1 stearoyl-CoA desaturase (delta-9 desaturase) [Catalinimonas alkaloidigena]
MLPVLLFFAAHWYLSLFAQTFFLHRYASHGMFTMSRGWERIFYVLTFVFQGSSFLSPRAYGIMHRLHHAYADTERDPHSPRYSKNLFEMMWRTKTIYNDILNDRAGLDPKFEKGVPNWPFMEWLGDRWPVRLAWGILYTLFYIQFATTWWLFLLLPIHYLMGPVHGAIINWYAHKVGYTNFKVDDTAKNLLPFDFLMMGESYHNNHHAFGGRANFGFKWHEFDPAYPIILLFNALGIIRLRRNRDRAYM